MARNQYPLVDLLIGIPSSGAKLGVPALLTHGTTINLYADEACTTVLNATTVGGAAISSVTVDGVTIPTFLGPDNYAGTVYGRPAGASGPGFPMLPRVAGGGGPGGPVSADSITDATTTGKAVLRAATQAAGRTALGLGTAAVASSGAFEPAGAVDTAVTPVSNALGDLTQVVNSLTLTPGPAGFTTLPFGNEDPATPVVVGDSWDYLVLRPLKILGAGAFLRGPAAGGDLTVDVRMSPTGTVAGLATVFTTGKPTIGAGNTTGLSGSPTTVNVPAGALIRVIVTAAPAGGGGSMTYRTPTAVATGTAAMTQLNAPKPSGQAAGDEWVLGLFLPAANVPTWPSGFTSLGQFGTADSAVGPFMLNLARKTASGSESATQAVTFASLPAAMVGLGVANGSLVTPASGHFQVNGTAAATHPTPSGVSTPVDGTRVVYLAAPRHTSGNVPGAITWPDGLSPALTTEAEANSNRSAAINVTVAVSSFLKATAGAVQVRTATSAAQARSETGVLMFTPSSGSAAEGLVVELDVQAA